MMVVALVRGGLGSFVPTPATRRSNAPLKATVGPKIDGVLGCLPDVLSPQGSTTARLCTFG